MATCNSRSRCRNAKECDYCAEVRQGQIGDIAEKLEQQHGQLTLTVLKPEQNTAKAIKELHASFMRRALAPAGIWTVETGEMFRKLHLNILSPKPLPARWRHAECYSELLTTTARDAAAYIAKRAGMPDEQQYSGRLYGSWGKIGEVLATQQRHPVVQAAALEVVLSGGRVNVETGEIMERNGGIEYRTDAEEAQGWTEGEPCKGRRVWWNANGQYTYKHPRPVLSKEQKTEIMRKHLPTLRAMVGKSVQI